MTRTAFVFPGQGSQAVGMLADVAAENQIVGETFREASDALGYDLWDLVQTGPEDKLAQTEFTQPALLTASIAMWRIARAADISGVDVVAGHSLGEYSALVAAGVLDFTDAVKLVRSRGQFMQTAVPLGQGGMAAVLGLSDDQVRNICNEASSGSEIVQAANFNAPGQVVIAGSKAALDTASEACKAAGAKRVMPLSASAPFHSALMQPAADRMGEALAAVQFNAPTMKVIQNVDADYHEAPDAIRENLVRQMCGAVLWTSTVERLAADGVMRLVECGPGKVLAGLNKRINKEVETLALGDVASMATTLEALAS